MPRIVHTRIQYQAGNHVKSAHEIHIYTHNDKIILVVVESGVGQSITNSMTWIASVVRNRYGITPDIIIEHDPTSERGGEVGTFDLVTLEWRDRQRHYDRIRWQASTRRQVETLIGEAFSNEEAPAERSRWIPRDMPRCRYCASPQRLSWRDHQWCARCGNLAETQGA